MARFEHYEQCPRCFERGKDSRGDNCAVYSDGGKHCFSCGFHTFSKHYTPRVQEKERLNNGQAHVLPVDFSREIPSHALQWLLQYGLPYSYWKPFIGWSEKESRLVFTIGDGPSFSIGRYIPRALAVPPERVPRKWYVWGNSHASPHVLGDYSKDAPCITLVEDLISAHKLAYYGFPTIPLFGTNIFTSCIPVLRHIGLPIVLWLDADQEGTLQRKCQWLSVVTKQRVSYVITALDPKCLSEENINGTLCKG